MATELAAGYVSLTVKLAQGGMSDVTKEVKKAGTEGGKVYSDEFGKQVEKDVGKKLPDTIGKATKSSGSGGIGKAAKEAAIEFGKGMLDGIEQELKRSSGVEKSLDGITDKVKKTTDSIRDIGAATGFDTSGIENASKHATDAIGGIETAVGSTKAALEGFKTGDIAGGLQGTVDALKGLENIGVPEDVASFISDIAGKSGEAKATVDEITGSVKSLADITLPEDSPIHKWLDKAGVLGDIAEIGVGIHEFALGATHFLEGTPFWGIGRTWGEKFFHDAENAGYPIQVKLSTEQAKAQLDAFFRDYTPAIINPQVRVPGQGTPGQNPLNTFAPTAPGPAPAPRNPLDVFAPSRIPGQRAGGDNMVRGPGGTDNVLSWLTAGEGVVKKSAMQGGGAAIVAALNRQGGIPGFAEGTPPDVLAALGLVGTPYSQAARNDCSGTVAQVINSVLGMTGSGLMSTKTAASWLAARGFVKGRGGPGQISVGWYDHGPNPNDGHMAMTLSNGQPAEAGGSHGQFLVGADAKGADWGSFDQHMYLPTLFGEGAGVSGGPSASSAVSGGSGGGGGGGTGGGGGGGGGGISDNPYKALQQINQQRAELDKQTGEQVKKIMPDMGQLADIGMGGLKETFLPPGFSDPTQWKSTQSVGALLKFIGNISGDPAAQSILGGIGAGITGSGSGLYSGIMGAIPQPFGTLQQQQPAVGDFPAAAGQQHLTGAAPGPGQVPVPGALGPGPSGPAINIENVNEPAGTAIAKANQLNNFQTAAQKQELVRR